jgi:hypothetical protein
MGFFNLFKKNKKEKEEEKIPEKEELNLPKCEYCDSYIHEWEKIKTFDKKKFHVKCFRKIKKQATKMAFQQ